MKTRYRYVNRTLVGLMQVAALCLLVVAASSRAQTRGVGINELQFKPVRAKLVRLLILPPGNHVACIDELEVFAAGSSHNLALFSAGAKASASSCIKGYETIHAVKHLNDGKYGNPFSWIAGGSAEEWAQIELPNAAVIDRVRFSRDREGKLSDRLIVNLALQVSLDGSTWQPPGGIRRIEVTSPLQLLARLDLEFRPDAIRRAIADMATIDPGWRPPHNAEQDLVKWEARLPALRKELIDGDTATVRSACTEMEEILAFSRSVLLTNPLLDAENILCLSRTSGPGSGDTYWQWGVKYGLTVNWSSDFRPQVRPVNSPWQDEIITIPSRPERGTVRSVYKPKLGQMIQHLDLHFDADRILFSMGDDTKSAAGAFQVYELLLDGSTPRRITRDAPDDVDNGDACYLPDGRIVFNSTRGFNGVPCHDGQTYVSGLCLYSPADDSTRMLTFDQESNFHPSLLNNGRVLYGRYEYINVSHQFGGLLFHMNPDGTGQMAYYGSNSYWPNRIFHARAVPGHPTKVVGIVCGHHGPNKTGPLIVFDPARGRNSTHGVVLSIPDLGQEVEPIVQDELYGRTFPKFLHPWPLNENYFLVSARLNATQQEYAIYLVDVFGNISEVHRIPGKSLMDPIVLKQRSAPPALPDHVDLAKQEGTVLLQDIYRGPGLKDVPRGSIKQLRLFSFNYYYRESMKFGHLATAGVSGPWEPRVLLGTVPVGRDGSALFTVPANMPIAIQPLDAQGRAVAQMRSWFTAMPGEFVSCVGCHESQNDAPPFTGSQTSRRKPSAIEPLFGPPRGFDFEVEIQPLLDRWCVGCHDGGKPDRPDFARKSAAQKAAINREYVKAMKTVITTPLTPSYIALHPYVYRPNNESNYRLQNPGEWLADTSPLIQMLQKGHHNVDLDDEAWRRLYTWIDLHAPDLGSWKYSEWGVKGNMHERRLEEYRKCGNRSFDVEQIPPVPPAPEFVQPARTAAPAPEPTVPEGWPFDAAQAEQMQKQTGLPTHLTLQIGENQKMEFVLIPAGSFVMGRSDGAPDEGPARVKRIDKPFYMSRCEIDNETMRAIGDPAHFSGFVSWRSTDWRGEGHPLDGNRQPSVRVSWQQATAFCRELSRRTKRKVALPTEAQWEWACRGGTDTPFWYGGLDQDFSTLENLAGREKAGLAFNYHKPKWFLRDSRFDDGQLVTAPVGSFAANPWGLHDMHGNVCEWTRSPYQPHADVVDEGVVEYVVRGGSWDDRPHRAVSAYRWKYPAWRKIHNVGFRVIVETSIR